MRNKRGMLPRGDIRLCDTVIHNFVRKCTCTGPLKFVIGAWELEPRARVSFESDAAEHPLTHVKDALTGDFAPGDLALFVVSR